MYQHMKIMRINVMTRLRVKGVDEGARSGMTQIIDGPLGLFMTIIADG